MDCPGLELCSPGVGVVKRIDEQECIPHDMWSGFSYLGSDCESGKVHPKACIILEEK